MTNWGREINEGLSSFLAFKKAFKSDPHEDYYRFKLENDPAYQMKRADDDLRKQGITPTGQQPGGWLERTFGIGPARTPGITPPGAIRTSYLPQMPAYEGGGVVDDPSGEFPIDSLAPQEIAYLEKIGAIRPQPRRPQMAMREPISADNPRIAGPMPDAPPAAAPAGPDVPMSFEGTPPPTSLQMPLEASVPRRPMQPVRDPADEINARGRLDRGRQEAFERSVPTGVDTGVGVISLEQAVPPPSVPGGRSPESQLNVMGGQTRDRMAEFERGIPEGIDTAPPGLERSSRLGRAVQPALDAVKRYAQGDPNYQRRQEIEQELYDAREGLFEQTTELERTTRAGRRAALEAELKSLDAPTSPVAAVDTNRMRLPGVLPRPTVGPGGGTAPAKAPTPVEVAGAVGTSTPGGMGQPPAPPVGSSGPPPAPVVNNSQPGGNGVAGPAPTPASGQVPGRRKALNDQSRTEAFDPTLDAADPGNVNVVNAQGATNSYGPQAPPSEAVQQAREGVIGSGAHFAKFLINDDGKAAVSPRERIALNAGVGAMPAEKAQSIVQAWNGGGALTPGAAMVRYMVAKHKLLAERGQSAAANQMAFEVLQRLNLEAAENGSRAVEFARAGNSRAALDALTRAHDFVPDGVSFQHSRDGRSMVLVNEYTGQPLTPVSPVTPQAILKMALGLSDGSMMWDYLLSRAAQRPGAPKPDRDAEGRALRNEGTRLANELKRKKLAGGGGKGGGGVDPAFAQFQALRGDRPASGNTTIINQGSDEDDRAPAADPGED